jgi:selenocysteine-specific elongation factor
MEVASTYNVVMYTDLILGTAGHIDHGKTSLVRALTGVDTDRLPEEKERGITIEPGFARLQVGPYCLGIVDVPGHERFIRQMLSGATGMDMVMLVIAANESIKPQTVEHLDILRLLDLPAGIIVITKSDLVDADWLALVEDEVRELVRDSFLTNAPIVRTSATTGAGLDELQRTLAEVATRVIEHENRFRILAPFRMAIDRSFSVAGHGAVVTGSVASGTAEVGATLMIEPGQYTVRVRSLQNHDTAATTVHRGQRAAINITGIDHHQIVRGQEITAPGHLAESKLMSVRLRLLASAPRPLKDRTRVRLHLGTADLAANVRLLEADELRPGQSGLAQVFLSDPAVATNQQPFVIRAESPAATIGGGRILGPNALRLSRSDTDALALLRDLGSDHPERRLAASIYLTPLGLWKKELAPRLAAVIDPEPILADLKARGEILEKPISPSQAIVVHALTLKQIAGRIADTLSRLHDDNPLRLDFAVTMLEQRFEYLPAKAIFDLSLQQLVSARTVSRHGMNVALAGRGPNLSKSERKLLEDLVSAVRAGGVQPPDAKQLRELAPKSKDSVANLLQLATAAGDLCYVADDFYLHRDALAEIQSKLLAQSGNGGFTVSQMREWLNTTRKYAVPLAEYLDKIQFTRREGDLRFILPAQARSLNPNP